MDSDSVDGTRFVDELQSGLPYLSTLQICTLIDLVWGILVEKNFIYVRKCKSSLIIISHGSGRVTSHGSSRPSSCKVKESPQRGGF